MENLSVETIGHIKKECAKLLGEMTGVDSAFIDVDVHKQTHDDIDILRVDVIGKEKFGVDIFLGKSPCDFPAYKFTEMYLHPAMNALSKSILSRKKARADQP